MLLNLSKIRTAHERYEKVYGIEAFAGDQDVFRVVQPVALAFDIDKDKGHFRLVGQVQTTLELACSRCLEPYTMEVAPSFDLRYQPRTANTGEGEREIEEDDLTTAFYENETIDLGQLMRESDDVGLGPRRLLLRGGYVARHREPRAGLESLEDLSSPPQPASARLAASRTAADRGARRTKSSVSSSGSVDFKCAGASRRPWEARLRGGTVGKVSSPPVRNHAACQRPRSVPANH